MAENAWTDDEDGEFNQQSLTKWGNTVTIFSDRTGNHWHYRWNDDEMSELEATSSGSARKEAEYELKQNRHA